jgi:hypothetical protein
MIIPPSTDHLSRILQDFPDSETLLSAFFALSKKADKPGTTRTGAVLAIAAYDMDTPPSGHFISFTIGDQSDPTRLGGWIRNAPEKIARLFARRRAGYNEVASAESAEPEHEDPDKRTYGGSVVFVSAVHVPRWEVYFSISGGNALVDEALSYALGCKVRLLPPILQHHNPYLLEACELLGCPSG